MRITFLGTSAMVPTKDRNVSGVFLQFKDQGILFDCGEGTQRQMNIIGLKRTAVTRVFISHWHGDHVAGLIGLLQTIGNEAENPKLDIYGPRGTKKRMEHVLQTCAFSQTVELTVHEIDPKSMAVCCNGDDFFVEAAQLDHSTSCLGFSFCEKDKRKINMEYLKKQGVPEGPHLRLLQDGKDIQWKGKKIDVQKATYVQKGKKITYITDTVPCKNAVLLAQNADILICEATYAAQLKEKADEHKHMTAQDAALIAQQAGTKKLILTHFSQRYKTVEELESDAKTHFPNVTCAYDFMAMNV